MQKVLQILCLQSRTCLEMAMFSRFTFPDLSNTEKTLNYNNKLFQRSGQLLKQTHFASKTFDCFRRESRF